MLDKVLYRRGTTLVRRLILAPGEVTPWHRDPFHRVAVIVTGDVLAIEYHKTEVSSTASRLLRAEQTGMSRPIGCIAPSTSANRCTRKLPSSFLTVPMQSRNPAERTSRQWLCSRGAKE